MPNNENNGLQSKAASALNKELENRPDAYFAKDFISLFERVRDAKLKEYEFTAEADPGQSETAKAVILKLAFSTVGSFNLSQGLDERDINHNKKASQILAELMPLDYIELQKVITNLKEIEKNFTQPEVNKEIPRSISILIEAAEIRQQQIDENLAVIQVTSALNEARNGVFDHFSMMVQASGHYELEHYHNICRAAANFYGARHASQNNEIETKEKIGMEENAKQINDKKSKNNYSSAVISALRKKVDKKIENMDTDQSEKINSIIPIVAEIIFLKKQKKFSQVHAAEYKQSMDKCKAIINELFNADDKTCNQLSKLYNKLAEDPFYDNLVKDPFDAKTALYAEKEIKIKLREQIDNTLYPSHYARLAAAIKEMKTKNKGNSIIWEEDHKVRQIRKNYKVTIDRLKNFFNHHDGISFTDKAALYNPELCVFTADEFKEILNGIIKKQKKQLIREDDKEQVIHRMIASDLTALLEGMPASMSEREITKLLTSYKEKNSSPTLEETLALQESILKWLKENKSQIPTLEQAYVKISELNNQTTCVLKFISTKKTPLENQIPEETIAGIKLSFIEQKCKEYSDHVLDDLLEPILTRLLTEKNKQEMPLRQPLISVLEAHVSFLKGEFSDRESFLASETTKLLEDVHEIKRSEEEQLKKDLGKVHEKHKMEMERYKSKLDNINQLIKILKDGSTHEKILIKLKEIFTESPDLIDILSVNSNIPLSLRNRLAESHIKLDAITKVKAEVKNAKKVSVASNKPIEFLNIERAIQSSAKIIVKNHDATGIWMLKWLGYILGTIFTAGQYRHEIHQSLFKTQAKGQHTSQSMINHMENMKRITPRPAKK